MAIINSVIVSGGGSAPAHYIEKTVDNTGRLANSVNFIDLTGVTDLQPYVLYSSYYNNQVITTANMSALQLISGASACASMFSNCVLLQSANLSSLETISGMQACYNMFQNASNMTAVDISSLETISGMQACNSMFSMTKISSFNISALTSITGQMACWAMFANCKQLTSIEFTSLQTLTGSQCCNYMFQNDTALTSVSFPALKSTSFGSYTNQFTGMLSGVTGCTVHFPSNLQSVIGSWSDVTAGFGGTNTTVLFDLPATE